MEKNPVQKKRILLVMPDWRAATSQWTPNDHPFLQQKALMPPLSLATIAALTPPNFDTDIWDESVHGLILENTLFESEYDLVGIGGYYTHFQRVKSLSAIFRSRGDFLVAGGAGVTTDPDKYQGLFDVMILGESEYLWPRFLNDFLEGNVSPVYREEGYVDMSHSPKPDWSGIRNLMAEHYMVGAVQTTRGCPFSCSFCNEWVVFGRKVRTKSVQQVMEEVNELNLAGLKHIVFAVDNFYGNHKYAREVLKELIDYNRKQSEPLSFLAQTSVTISHDEEFLKLMADAGFTGLFVGIESPSSKSLIESKKLQNLKGDLVSNCKKILSYGLPIEASMIVGFDQDEVDVFDAQFEFLRESSIPYPRIRMLQAKPGTVLFDQLVRQRRVLDIAKLHPEDEYFDAFLISNIIPARMSRTFLFENYITLMERLFDLENFTERMIGFIDLITYLPENAARGRSGTSSGQLPPELITFIRRASPGEQPYIEAILKHCAARVPHQLRNIVGLIVRQQLEHKNVVFTKQTILSQLEFERNLDLNDCILEYKDES